MGIIHEKYKYGGGETVSFLQTAAKDCAGTLEKISTGSDLGLAYSALFEVPC